MNPDQTAQTSLNGSGSVFLDIRLESRRHTAGIGLKRNVLVPYQAVAAKVNRIFVDFFPNISKLDKTVHVLVRHAFSHLCGCPHIHSSYDYLNMPTSAHL